VATCQSGWTSCATGDAGVAGNQVVAVEEARRGRGRADPRRRVVVRAGPVHEQETEVGEAVAEGADLPVEHREDVAAAVDDAVPESEVTVHDRALGLRRDARREQRVDAIDLRHLPGLRRFELCVPSLQLARYQLVAPRQVAETDRVDVDRVQRHQRVDERLAAVGACSFVELCDCRDVVVQHDSTGPQGIAGLEAVTNQDAITNQHP